MSENKQVLTDDHVAEIIIRVTGEQSISDEQVCLIRAAEDAVLSASAGEKKEPKDE